MATIVAEMTPTALQTLIFKTVQTALTDTMGRPDWTAEWQELMAHQRHLASLYAEFAYEDVALAEAGLGEYTDWLADEDGAT